MLIFTTHSYKSYYLTFIFLKEINFLTSNLGPQTCEVCELRSEVVVVVRLVSLGSLPVVLRLHSPHQSPPPVKVEKIFQCRENIS